VSDVDGPSALVQQSVVESANENRVVEAGRAAVDPVDNMMPVAPVKCFISRIFVSGV